MVLAFLVVAPGEVVRLLLPDVVIGDIGSEIGFRGSGQGIAGWVPAVDSLG